MPSYKKIILVIACSLLSLWSYAQQPTPTVELDAQIEALKQDVLELNRDLFILEEELLYPASTQIAVFIALDVGDFFKLDSVQLKIDDQVVANYLYTERQIDALRRGGVQRLYTGNLRSGEHELVALFVGKGPNDRDYRRGTNKIIVKDVAAKFIELRIEDQQNTLQPEFTVREW